MSCITVPQSWWGQLNWQSTPLLHNRTAPDSSTARQCFYFSACSVPKILVCPRLGTLGHLSETGASGLRRSSARRRLGTLARWFYTWLNPTTTKPLDRSISFLGEGITTHAFYLGLSSSFLIRTPVKWVRGIFCEWHVDQSSHLGLKKKLPAAKITVGSVILSKSLKIYLSASDTSFLLAWWV